MNGPRRWTVSWAEEHERVVLGLHVADRCVVHFVMTDIEAANLATELEREAHHTPPLPFPR